MFLELVVVVVFEIIHVVVMSQGFVKAVVGRRVVVFDVPFERRGRWWCLICLWRRGKW